MVKYFVCFYLINNKLIFFMLPLNDVKVEKVHVVNSI